MTALLCLLMGVAAVALAVVLPDQRLSLGVVAIVAGAAAVALTPAARRAVAEPVVGQPPVADDSAGAEAIDPDATDPTPWERATPD